MRIVMDLTEKVRAHVSIRERSSQENVTLSSGNSVYRLKDGKSGRVIAVWESGNEKYAFVEFDLPHVSDSYENQRDLCRSPIGHTGSPCMFCGCEAQPEKA